MGGGDTNVVQQTKLKEKHVLFLGKMQFFAKFCRHDGNPFAMGDIIYAHKVQRVGKRVNYSSEINCIFHIHTSVKF